MATHHLVTPDGTVILPGSMLHATEGVHAGTHWRLERLYHNGVTHILRCTRYVHRIGRVVMDLHPSVFGLSVIVVSQWTGLSLGFVHSLCHKISDGLVMGVLALIPLAVYESAHGGEHARHLLEMLFG